MRTRSRSGSDRVPIGFVSGCLGNKRLSTTDWKDRAAEEQGVSKTRFFALLKELTDAKKVSKSPVDDKWEQIKAKSQNWYNEKDQ